MKTALLVALCALLGSTANSLFFYITESRQRCFLQDIPEQTLVVGNYKIPTLKTFDAPDFDGIVWPWPSMFSMLTCPRVLLFRPLTRHPNP